MYRNIRNKRPRQYYNCEEPIVWLKRKIIATHIPYETEEEEIKAIFMAIGNVQDFRLVRCKNTDRHLGFAFITYQKSVEATKAIETLNGLRMHRKVLKVTQARSNSFEIKYTNLYVNGLPKTMTQEKFLEIFSKFGEVISATLVRDNIAVQQLYGPDTTMPGLCTGVGFIRYNRRAEACYALNKMNGSMVDNKRITVRLAYNN